MEKVWKEIKLASLCDCSNDGPPSSNATTHSACPNLILHEFFNKHTSSPTRAHASTVCTPRSTADSTFGAFLEHSQSASVSLSSTGSDPQKQSKESFLTSSDIPFDAALISSPICPSKRAQEDGNNSDDRRHKRMMKNRESAARSRARKQAYTNELELELAELKEENARLRKQQEKFLLTSSAQQSKKPTLYRTLSAPF